MKLDHSPMLYQLASLFVALAGLVLIVGTGFNLFGPDAAVVMSIGAIYLLAALLLYVGRRWLAYLTYIVTLIGAISAFVMLDQQANLTQWIYMALVILNGLSALLLFVIIWRNKRRPS